MKRRKLISGGLGLSWPPQIWYWWIAVTAPVDYCGPKQHRYDWMVMTAPRRNVDQTKGRPSMSNGLRSPTRHCPVSIHTPLQILPQTNTPLISSIFHHHRSDLTGTPLLSPIASLHIVAKKSGNAPNLQNLPATQNTPLFEVEHSSQTFHISMENDSSLQKV